LNETGLHPHMMAGNQEDASLFGHRTLV
jgi:hypothetical protein